MNGTVSVTYPLIIHKFGWDLIPASFSLAKTWQNAKPSGNALK